MFNCFLSQCWIMQISCRLRADAGIERCIFHLHSREVGSAEAFRSPHWTMWVWISGKLIGGEKKNIYYGWPLRSCSSCFAASWSAALSSARGGRTFLPLSGKRRRQQTAPPQCIMAIMSFFSPQKLKVIRGWRVFADEILKWCDDGLKPQLRSTLPAHHLSLCFPFLNVCHRL